MLSRRRWEVKLDLLIVFGGFLLSACVGQQTQNTPQPSSTPSNFPFTPTLKGETFTPSPTNTHKAVTSVPFAHETPTALPTPPKGATTYQLKAWDDESALGLIGLAEQFAFADNIPMPFGDKRFNYQADQSVIKLVAQEALYRFPNTQHTEKLKWRIALADTILNNPDSDAWILNEIENALNNRNFTSNNLGQFLNSFGFEIGYEQSAPNLFGDDQPAQVIWITRQDNGYTGLYAALSQDNRGKFTLTKIYSSWDFNFGYEYQPLRIEDHTGDGTPEVIIFPGYHNGSSCGYELVIYQWKNSQFVDASQGQFSFDQCGPTESWEYGTPDKNGAQPIENWQYVSYASAVIRHEHYVWNGEGYELSDSEIVPPEKLDSRTANWIAYAMNAGEYQTVIEKIGNVLSDKSQVQVLEPELGSSYPDYLRFQLGLAYAFQSNTSQARAIFEDIQRNPQSLSTATLSNAAQAYLDNYNGDTDHYRACQAALKVMEQSFANQAPDKFDGNYDQYLLQAWGYKPSSMLDSIALCNLDIAFSKITSQLDVTQFAKVPEQLKEAGVLIRSTAEVDLDGDGQKEWVLLIDTPGDDAPVNLWILLMTPNDILSLPVVSWQRKQFDLPQEKTATSGLSLKTIESPEGTTIALILVGEHLYTIKLNSTDKSIDYPLFSIDSVEGFTLYQRNDNLEIEIATNNDYCQHCKEIYVWFEHGFTWPELVTTDQLEAEANLLKDSNPKNAIPILQNLLSNPSNYDSSRLMYLLGLAYELTDDDNNAIQTYWKIWHDFPQSSYARLALAKLELKK